MCLEFTLSFEINEESGEFSISNDKVEKRQFISVKEIINETENEDEDEDEDEELMQIEFKDVEKDMVTGKTKEQIIQNLNLLLNQYSEEDSSEVNDELLLIHEIILQKINISHKITPINSNNIFKQSIWYLILIVLMKIIIVLIT